MEVPYFYIYAIRQNTIWDIRTGISENLSLIRHLCVYATAGDNDG